MKRGFRVAQSNCNDDKKYRKSKKRKNLKIKVLSGLLAAMVCASGVWYAFYRNGWEFELPWAAERKYALLDSGITNEATGIQVKYSTVGKTDNKNEDSALESKDVSDVELPYAAEYFSSFLTEEEQTVCRQLYKGFREFQTDIDITDGVIESEDICSFIVLCTSCSPEFSYIGQEYSVTLDSSGYVMSVEVSYTMTAEEAAAQQAEIDARAEELIAGMESDWDDYEKFRYIHDNLILSCQYKENEGSCYTAYGCLVEGEAVCEGYAKAMLTLCEKVGIGCVPVVGSGYENGEPLPHIWNKVLLDGEWYCTDPTWDDPVSQMGEDYIRYDYFAITDKQMNLDHTADENKYLHYPAAQSVEDDFYRRSGAFIESADDAENIILNAVCTAMAGNGDYARVKCADENVYGQTLKTVFEDETESGNPLIFTILKEGSENYPDFGYSYAGYSIIKNEKDHSLTIKLIRAEN